MVYWGRGLDGLGSGRAMLKFLAWPASHIPAASTPINMGKPKHKTLKKTQGNTTRSSPPLHLRRSLLNISATKLRRDNTWLRWHRLHLPQPSLLHLMLQEPERTGMAQKGITRLPMSLIPLPALVGGPAPSGGHLLESLLQPLPPCLVELPPSTPAHTAPPSSSWDSSIPEWDPHSLPQRSQAHRDRAPSLSPHQRESPHTQALPQAPQPSGHQGAHSHLGHSQGSSKAKHTSNAPYQPPQGGYPLPASYKAPALGAYAHTATD